MDSLSKRCTTAAPSIDLVLANARVGHHFMVLLGHADVAKRHAVDALDIVGREEVHIVVALGQLERDIGNGHAQRQRFDADFLVRVFTLGVQKAQNVRVVGVEIDRARPLARAELVGIGEGVLKKEVHNLLKRYQLRYFESLNGGSTDVMI